MQSNYVSGVMIISQNVMVRVHDLQQLSPPVFLISQYYELSKKLLGPKVTESVLKATVFGQFAGGLNERETRGVAMRLAEAGVSSIWNYCIEKDLE